MSLCCQNILSAFVAENDSVAENVDAVSVFVAENVNDAENVDPESVHNRVTTGLRLPMKLS